MRTWRDASRDLARRVARRDRLGAALAPLGRWLLLAAVLGGAAKALGLTVLEPHPIVALVAAAGLVHAAIRIVRSPGVAVADAAWALDRIAGAKERGLVAATIEGPVGAEAAWAAGRVDPPRVRLLPPAGLALVLGGLLAVAVAVVVPSAAADDPAGTSGPTGAAAHGPTAGTIADQEEAARGDAELAETAADVREALGLGPQAAADPARLAERLEDADVRQAVAERAEGSEFAPLLAGDDAAEALAGALADAARAEERARSARRQAAAARAEGAFLTVPPDRRLFLERYYSRVGPPSGGAHGGRR